MQKLAPVGPVVQAGTLSGNPVAVAAGLATLRRVLEPGFFPIGWAASTAQLVAGLTREARSAGVAFSRASLGGMFGVFFRDAAPASFAEVMQSDREAFNRFFHAMLEGGVYLAPSAFEAGFVSSAHSDSDIAATISAACDAFAKVRS